ncbi:MAG TPA: type II toxin-antitoxin system PemK/MazF family toxin [Trueperaceae bacterium]|nr:type II toxin-antitoxin system PemK/MazF family toxin [Trueperaceae bacterium]
MKLERGALVLVALDPVVGHEQRGIRPFIVISDADVNLGQRYPLVAIVPVTSTPGAGALYPELRPSQLGLQRTSYALIDQIRSVDKRRIVRLFGAVSLDEVKAIDTGLELFLGLGPNSP